MADAAPQKPQTPVAPVAPVATVPPLPVREMLIVFAAVLALRVAYLLVVAQAAPGGAAWLQTPYDAPAYMAITRSFPWFQSTPDLVATARWYPFSPLLIRLAGALTSFDFGAAAVPVVASSAAVALFHGIARTCALPFAATATACFAFAPPKWFLLSIIPMSEPVYVALTLAAALAMLRGRHGIALAAIAAALLTKATAVLWVAIFAAWCLRDSRRRAVAVASLLAAPLALQIYLACFHGFETFPLFLHAQSGYHGVEYSTPTGQAFSWPFRAFAEGLGDATIPIGFRATVVAEFVFYALATWFAWRRRADGPAARLIFLWLAVFLGFHACVYGSLHLVGFRGFTRLMIPAAPAALLAWFFALEGLLARGWLRAVAVVASAGAGIAVTWATLRPMLAR